MIEIVLGSAVFTVLVLGLAMIVLGARRLLMPHGTARVTVNGDTVIDADVGEKLLGVLEHGGVNLPTSCGGVGTCGLCRVKVAGASEPLPVERAKLGQAELDQGLRFACQVVVRSDLDVQVAPELLAAERWNCTVTETRTVTPLIKEIILALPGGAARPFRAGSYVQITAPPFTLKFADIAVSPEHEAAWRQLGLRALAARSASAVTRAYSLANPPDITDALVFNIRLALPPSGRTDLPPGIVSSYLFGLKTGDTVEVSGPFGNFFATETDKEMVLIGGGVGMAPLRAHVLDQLQRLKSGRRISYWYGARSLADLFYVDEMERLAAEHANFTWHVALSDPAPDEAWDGDTGFIHEVAYRGYLKDHPDPAGCEYYLCGPPLMMEAVRAMLDKLGVARDTVFFDDFGG